MTKISKHTVVSGDSAWKVAKKQLKTKGNGKVTNTQIVKEMNRLATLNGCKSVEDFSQKFFSSTGKNIITEKEINNSQQKRTLNKKDTLNIANEAVQDNTRVREKDTLRQTIPLDTIKKNVPKKDSLKTDTVAKKTYTTPKISSFEKEAAHINNIKGSKNRIIEYNKKHAKGNYVIVDKQTCKATVYSKNGKALKSYEVLLGASKGDDLNTAFAKDPKLASAGRRTVPGEFSLSKRIGLHGGLRTTGAKSETMDPDIENREWAPGYWGKRKFNGGSQAIHGTADRENRDKLYGDGNLANNRQSMGCINIPVEQLNEMEKVYGIKTSSKLYVLPETKGNELVLTKQKDGTVKFITKYKAPKQNVKVAKIQNKIANKNIQRQVAAKKKVAQQKALAEQKEFHFLKPNTWKNLFS